MTKALMVSAGGTSLASGDEINLFGYSADSTTEANTQADCCANATFSNLRARIIAGGSGTNNFRFRVAGGDGNQLATRSGTGDCEDTVNTDVLTTGDWFNIAYTDTGTNSSASWTACNIELASGYGALHGSATFTGVVHDAASSTRFLALSGAVHTDGNATEANAAFKARGYTTFDAIQCLVTANARTNTSTIKNRINSGDGTGTLAITAGSTGLFVVTGLNDAIGDGHLIGGSITLDTGVEDLTISLVAALLKSTNTKQDIWCSAATAGLARSAVTDGETFFVIGSYMDGVASYTEAQARVAPGYAGTASNWRIYHSGNTYTADATLNVYKNGSVVGTVTITAGVANTWHEDTVNSFSFAATDELSFSVSGGTTGTGTMRMIGITLAPTVAGGIVGPLVGDGALVGGPLFSRLVH